MFEPRPTAGLRMLYVRAIALVNAVALASFGVQADALIGPDGILPVAERLALVASRTGIERYWEHPTLLWLWPGGTHAMVAVGIGVALAVVAGFPLEGPALLVLWTIYVSICTAGQVFLHFQWDGLLVEATFAAVLVARWMPGQVEPPRWAWWVQWWLAFRLMFFGGLVKLTSGDPTWRDLTALDFHFWTQPLPNPISRFAHHWPDALHAAGVVVTFGVELVVPFAILLGRWGRLSAFVLCSGLMAMLALTGNYGFFQLLSLVVLLSLLDDGFLPERLRREADRRGWHLGLPVGLGLVGLSLLWIPGYAALPAWGQSVLQLASPFRTVNPYGLFAVMTTDRPEIQLEGSSDGQTWRELDLRFKPGSDLARVPPQVAPHMPRVDWQLWFAALGSCRQNPWLVELMQRVADGSEAVEPLFRAGTFADGHPPFVRAVGWRYTFTERGSERVWDREPLGIYCPAVARRPPGTSGSRSDPPMH